MLPDLPPNYIPHQVLAEQHLTFRWDDWKASEDFQHDASALLEATAGITPRGRIALTIGLYEWVIWRLRFASTDPAPFQIAEAAWCATVDRRYMAHYEFDRHAWIGPVRGPLWCAMTWLVPAVLLSDDSPEELESGLSYLTKLAHHVVDDQAALDAWTSVTLGRFRRLYPATPDGPFDDLFGERQEERRGPLLPREILDPSFSFEPDMTNQLIDEFLRTVDFNANPFLKSPELLVAEGFSGVPYRLQPS